MADKQQDPYRAAVVPPRQNLRHHSARYGFRSGLGNVFPVHGRGWVSRSLMLAFAALVILIVEWPQLSVRLHWLTSNNQPTESGQTYHGWDDIPTRPELEYVRCYQEFYCARLELPLDYFNGTTNATISLAVIKLPATVDVDHPDYKGPVLTNPGGPGGSGIGFAYRSARTIQSIIEGSFPASEASRSFDIVSFDPRGVGLTLPAVTCSGSRSQSDSWQLRRWEEGTLTSSDASFGRQWSMMQAHSGHCADVEEDSIQHHLTTAYVARDMLELVEASARWQRKRLAELGSDVKIQPGKAKIQYWGFSYGSVLGNTFAAMFPDRVGRLIVDGVVDAHNYMQGLWSNNLLDTEKDQNLFYHHCARVGYPTCPLAEKKHPTAQKVKQRTLSIIKDLWHNPVAVIEPYADVLTWSDIRNVNFVALYSPLVTFPAFAKLLADLEAGETEELTARLRPSHFSTCPAPDSAPGQKPGPFWNATFVPASTDDFAAAAIMCTDGLLQTDVTKEEFRAHMDALLKVTPTLGDLWSAIRLRCLHYPLRPHYRFPGPFAGNTSHPLLMIGNTADPVTPVAYAHKMAAGFTSARVLTQDSPGHCSISSYSPCTVKYVHEYFYHGTLPPEGTVCDAAVQPFGPTPDQVQVSEEVKTAVGAYAELGLSMLGDGAAIGLHDGAGRVDLNRMHIPI